MWLSKRGQTKANRKLIFIPTTFMFTPRPSSGQKWVKKPKVGRQELTPEAPTLGLWALGSLSAAFLNYEIASELPKTPIF